VSSNPPSRALRLVRAVLAVLAVAVIVVLVLQSGATARAADVRGDNGQDRYVGTGGLILPGGVDSRTRVDVAGCGGCRWRLSAPCALELPGTPFPGQSACLSVARGCPVSGELLRVWFEPSGGAWTDRGLICLQDGGPVTVARLAGAARERFTHDLPPVVIGITPASGVLAQIPVVFASGQPAGAFTARYDLLGEEVHLVGRPRWSWAFGDGATLVTDDPGGSYPHLAVSHAYRRAGREPVDLRTDWAASFTAAGLGPFPITEPVSQTASRSVAVGEGRALLAVR